MTGRIIDVERITEPGGVHRVQVTWAGVKTGLFSFKVEQGAPDGKVPTKPHDRKIEVVFRGQDEKRAIQIENDFKEEWRRQYFD